MFRLIRLNRTRAFRLLGRRGILLLLFGALWVCVGVSTVLIERPPRFSGEGPRIPVLTLLDGPGAGWLWIAAGLISAATGLIRRRFDGKDEVGFNALLVPPFIWFMGYGWSQAMWLTTNYEYGQQSWFAMAVWAIVCAWVLLSAGWPDPDDPAARTREGS